MACAVFMQSDIVNFQRPRAWQGRRKFLAGLAAVLPEECVSCIVASIPHLAALGTRFVLQGRNAK